jgi:hypothetical protein
VALSTEDTLTAVAKRVLTTKGAGSGHVYGISAHTAFADEVKKLGRTDLHTEVTYLNGVPVRYGTPGAVRVDVVEGPINAPTAIYDLKTGIATLGPKQVAKIQAHLPAGSAKIPIKEIRGD